MITWHDVNHFTINDFPAFAMSDDLPLNVVDKVHDVLFVQKTQTMLERYAQLDDGNIKRIFEIGLLKGGCCAYFQALYQAEKIVGIDVSEEALSTLLEYKQQQNLEETIITYGGVDQGNREKLLTILKKEFNCGELDLICDDASHLLRETKAAFNTCFPWLREGGKYVIEDWRWAHWVDGTPSLGGKLNCKLAAKLVEGQPPMSLLGMQLLMVAAARPDVIKQVSFDFHFITVEKGSAVLDPENFSVKDYYAICNTQEIREQDKLW